MESSVAVARQLRCKVQKDQGGVHDGGVLLLLSITEGSVYGQSSYQIWGPNSGVTPQMITGREWGCGLVSKRGCGSHVRRCKEAHAAQV